ncbi:MAG: hypothetical protein KDI11_09630 [Alphaproteobacteria bacterium]|nr:hypothetical protein [Alphaproteobacteria bacterium]
MNIELGILNDGGVVLVSDNPLPEVVRRVEYYRDQRLFMLVYNNDDEGQLMDYEIPEDMSHPIEKSPNVIIYTMFKNHDPIGYKVPLIKVGELF